MQKEGAQMKNSSDGWGKEYHSFVRESAKAFARMGDAVGYSGVLFIEI